MKKIVYSIALYIALAGAAQAQTAIKETRDDVADLIMLNEDMMIYTKKEAGGQYLYTEQKNVQGTAQKAAVLNAGAINAVVGINAAAKEVYIFHQVDRRNQYVAFYNYNNGTFTKTGERKLPKLRNNSYNLGLFLSEDKNDLVIAAELGKTKGYDDLYLSKWEGEKWTKPKNMGKPVNTRNAEFAPFIANDSLFFSRKEDGAAYVYAVPLNQAKEAKLEPQKLGNSINVSEAFNAYYKKYNNNELWITATKEGDFKAYTSAAQPATQEVEPTVEVAAANEPAANPETKNAIAEKTISDFTISYGLNKVYLGKADEEVMATYLNGLPVGATINIKGVSDGKGSEKAKKEVSRLRANLLKSYIKNNFAGKKFMINTSNEVRTEIGDAHRIVILSTGN